VNKRKASRPDTPIFPAVALLTFFFMNLIAIYLFFRGHDLPGGGFIAGIASGLSVLLLELAYGSGKVQQIFGLKPSRLMAGGLALAIGTAFAPWLFGLDFFEHVFWKFKEVPLFGTLKINTPMLFDLGVYLVVVGITIKIISMIDCASQGRSPFPMHEEARFSAPDEVPIESALGVPAEQREEYKEE